MSRVLVRRLTCDDNDCTATFLNQAGVFSIDALRSQARTAGWRKGQGDRDYCPSHRPPWPGLAAWVRRSDFAETVASRFVEANVDAWFSTVEDGTR